MDYDPSADLEKIKARLLAINFADDAVNPPELGVLEAGVARIRGRAKRRGAGVAAIARASERVERGDLEEPFGRVSEIDLTCLASS